MSRLHGTSVTCVARLVRQVTRRSCASNADFYPLSAFAGRHLEKRMNLADMEGRRDITQHGPRGTHDMPPPLSPDQRQLARTMKALAKRGQWQEALAVVENATDPDRRLYAQALDACAKALQASKATELYNSMAEKTPVVYSSMILMMGRMRRIDEVEKILSDMRSQGIIWDRSLYTSAITTFGIAYQTERAIELLDDMKVQGLTLQQTEFGCALGACGKAGDSQLAWEIFARMEDEGVTPHVGHITSLVISHARTRNEEGARRAFAEIALRGLQADIVAFTSLVTCFAGVGQLEKIDKVLRDMRVAKVEPHVFFYNQYLRAAHEDDEQGVLGAGQRFDEILVEMQKAGIEPNSNTDVVIRKRRQSLDIWAHAAQTTIGGTSTAGIGRRPPLPFGWSSAVDPASGVPYYWQTADPAATTTWTRPDS